MLISEISIKGYKSFGNNPQVLKLNTKKGELVLLVGSNGTGKSVIKKTKMNINIPLELFTLEDFLIFLETMGSDENSYVLYIKENNKNLYEEYIKYLREKKKQKLINEIINNS